MASRLANRPCAFIEDDATTTVQGPVGHDACDGVLITVLGRAVSLAYAFANAFEPVAHVDLIHVAGKVFARLDVATFHLRTGNAVTGNAPGLFELECALP